MQAVDNPANPDSALYDVFLSHNSKDKPVVEEIALRLRNENIAPFLDRWCLTPGMPWQSELTRAIEQSKKVAVFIGPHETGPWHHREMQLALQSKKDGEVIPVLLPGGDRTNVPEFLPLLTWVDLSNEDDHEMKRFIAAIKNAVPPTPDSLSGTGGHSLVTSKSNRALNGLEVGLSDPNSFVSLVEKIASRLMRIGDRRQKKAELKRLIKLLNETRIARTLNMGLSSYLRLAIEDYRNDTNTKEIDIAVQQIEQSIASMLRIIDTMANERDRVTIYENRAWSELYGVIHSRRRALDELKELEINEENLERLSAFADKYEGLTGRLGSISLELSQYGRELDSA